MRRSEEYANIVRQSAVMAGGLGIPGSFCPPLDLIGMSGIWLQMLNRIINESGHSVNGTFVTKLVLSLTTSGGLYIAGSKLANFLLHLIPGPGNIAAAATNSAFNYIYTDRLGRFLVQQFDQDSVEPQAILAAAMSAIAMIFALPGDEEIAVAGSELNSSSDAELVQSEVVVSDPVDSSLKEVSQQNSQPRFGWHPGSCSHCSHGILYGECCGYCGGTGIESKPN